MYKLNRRIIIHRYTTSQNEFGGLQSVQTDEWEKWAEARDREGSPVNNYQQGQWTYDQIFVMRYETERPTKSNDVIEYEGMMYKINSIQIRSEGAKDWEYIRTTKIEENL